MMLSPICRSDIIPCRRAEEKRHAVCTLSSAAAEVSTCIAQKLLANERIRIGPEHNGARLTAWRPADHVAGRRVAGHPRGRPRLAIGALFGIDPLLLARLARIGGGSDENSETCCGEHQSHPE